ncbi:hypothetical protein CW712_06075 [Candidatus Bathyarchaeota archaeon]|nr:MAG: hypothetical protein CW712_06075 [Candidatus Bathyarchaeota archaeon]
MSSVYAKKLGLEVIKGVDFKDASRKLELMLERWLQKICNPQNKIANPGVASKSFQILRANTMIRSTRNQ